MNPEERDALKAELRAEIMAEVHAAIWAAISVHVNGPSLAGAAPGVNAMPYQHPFFSINPINVTAGGAAGGPPIIVGGSPKP